MDRKISTKRNKLPVQAQESRVDLPTGCVTCMASRCQPHNAADRFCLSLLQANVMTEDPQHYTEISRRSDLPTGSASIFPASRLDHPHAQVVQVELRPFNDRALNRVLAILCERVNQVSLRLPDGRPV
jgi:hypothetical protein